MNIKKKNERLGDKDVVGMSLSIDRSIVIFFDTCGLSTAAKMPKSMGNSANLRYICKN